MKFSEIFKLVLLNLSQNKSKVILTSTGILVGAATIMLVLAIGTGGKEEVAEQFQNLNAGAVDISYEYEDRSFGGFGGGEMPGGGALFGGSSRGGSASNGGGGMPGGFGGGMDMGGFDTMPGMDNTSGNTEKIILSTTELDALKSGIAEVSEATISYTTKADTEGGDLEEATSYTIAGVKENYAQMSNLTLAVGDFLTEENDSYKERVCVLGSTGCV